MSDIFISYKHEDLVLAKALAMELAELGWTVWWDHDIPAGQDYDEVIINELSSVKCVLVLWSERSVNSRNVKDEANVALDRKVLIPIIIGKDTRPPLGFRMIQGVRWNQNDHVEEAELDELLRHINRLIGNSPKSKNKPAPTLYKVIEELHPGITEVPSVPKDPFKIDLNVRYNHPSMQFAFMILIEELADRDTESYYYLDLWFNNQIKQNTLHIMTKYSQYRSKSGNMIDLYASGVWATVIYNGQGLPFQLSRSQTSILGRWLNAEETTPEKKGWEF